MNTPHTFLFVGPPSSGKGTQSELLAKTYSIPRIDVGSVLRDRTKKQDADGRHIAQVMQAGQALADTMIRPIVEPIIAATISQHKGLILDGYCRTVEQAEHLQQMVQKKLIPPVIVIHLTVNEKEADLRMKHRRYCSDCSTQQYLVSDTETATKCLRCGGHLIKRSDDETTIFQKRLKTYHQYTVPAIAHLHSFCTVITINGEHSIPIVSASISQAIVRAIT